jgi:Type II restriction endonuclease, TdeIII
MKQRQLTALAMRRSPDAFAWWGVPYDPYGRAGAYDHPHPSSSSISPREVRLGPPFWNFVGAQEDTYESLLQLYGEVGAEHVDQLEELRAAVAAAASEL